MTAPKGIPFAKLSGSGNDFILVDGRGGRYDALDLTEMARMVCRRHDSVGADGLIVLVDADGADFGWHFVNSDGSRADMCGNGGRCAARFAQLEGIAGQSMTFLTGAGVIAARVDGPVVRIQLTTPRDFKESMVVEVEGMEYSLSFINTGVPHAVLFLNSVDKIDVEEKGRIIRYHPRFAPAGTNVNFVSVADRGRIRVRTYERGVEGETKACGTGSVAAAWCAREKGMVDDRVEVVTSGGEILTVYMEEGPFGVPTVHLEGSTRFICRGTIEPEGLA